jgi:hypothetical protein
VVPGVEYDEVWAVVAEELTDDLGEGRESEKEEEGKWRIVPGEE